MGFLAVGSPAGVSKATLLQDISDGLVASKELLKDAEQLHHESQARCLWAFIFDDRVLENKDITLPANVSGKSLLLNHRMSFYVKNRVLILASLAALACLLWLSSLWRCSLSPGKTGLCWFRASG